MKAIVEWMENGEFDCAVCETPEELKAEMEKHDRAMITYLDE